MSHSRILLLPLNHRQPRGTSYVRDHVYKNKNACLICSCTNYSVLLSTSVWRMPSTRSFFSLLFSCFFLSPKPIQAVADGPTALSVDLVVSPSAISSSVLAASKSPSLTQSSLEFASQSLSSSEKRSIQPPYTRVFARHSYTREILFPRTYL